MRIIAILSLFICFSAWGRPDSIEVWFLSSDGLSSVLDTLVVKSKMLASKDCIPMGEGCFHPQLGYIEEKVKTGPQEETDRTIPDDGIDLIECKEKEFFNIFCETKTVSKIFPRVEVWLDYSSSLRVLDPSDKSGACHRSAFIRSLKSDCPKNRLSFSIFNTSIKQLSVAEDVCTNYGTNNSKKLMKWIDGSMVKKLYIITDIDEHTRQFKEYLDSIGAVIKGVDFGSISAAKLASLTSEIVAACKKIKPEEK